MRTAAAIDAIARLAIFAAMVLIYQYFFVAYIQHEPEKAWSMRLWRMGREWWIERHRIPVPQAYSALRLKKTIELPEEP